MFACGRYEGIDQRVIDDAASRMDVREVSVGDYVLNGGEVAALAIIEAVVRLLPGFMGNAESLSEESFADGLLEYPVYTKPASWRGHDVPDVLLSGDHARIAAWRHDQSVRRTAERRPDLAHASRAVDLGALAAEIALAAPADAAEVFTLQRACWVQEQQANPGVHIPPLHESFADVQAWLEEWTTLVLRSSGRLVGAVRGHLVGDTWDIGRLMVAPDLQGRGIGRLLLDAIEIAAPAEATGFVLFTGAGSERNIRIYKKAGYRFLGPDPDTPGAVRLSKRRPSGSRSGVHEAVEGHAAEGGEPLGRLGEVGERRPRVDGDPQLLPRGPRPPRAEHLVADEDSAGTADRAPEVLPVGLLGHDEPAVAGLQEQVERAEQRHHPRDVGRRGERVEIALEDRPLLALDHAPGRRRRASAPSRP